MRIQKRHFILVVPMSLSLLPGGKDLGYSCEIVLL